MTVQKYFRFSTWFLYNFLELIGICKTVIKKNPNQTNHMHNHFEVFFQQAASLLITGRENVPCDTRLGLAKPAGDIPVISL